MEEALCDDIICKTNEPVDGEKYARTSDAATTPLGVNTALELTVQVKDGRSPLWSGGTALLSTISRREPG
jgi:hypothetical protein